MRLSSGYFLIALLLIMTASSVGKAASELAAEPLYIDSPTGCLQKNIYPCLLRASENNMSFSQGPQKFKLAKKASLKWLSPSQVEVMQGDVWVMESHDLQVFASPALNLTLNGDFLLEKRSDHSLQLRNLAGVVKFQSKAVFSSEALPAGFENWYGALNTDGKLQRGVIRPIEISSFLKAWIPLSEASSAEVKRSLLHYRDSWVDVTEFSAQMYKEIIDRRVASSDEKSRTQKLKLQSVKQDQNRYRQMFRERNNL